MILNLTQHPASSEQVDRGVVDLRDEQLGALKELLTFDFCPNSAEIKDRAEAIAELASFNGLSGDEGDSPVVTLAMIGGALWLMEPLTKALKARGIQALFCFH